MSPTLLWIIQTTFLAMAVITAARFVLYRGRERGLVAAMMASLSLPVLTGWWLQAGGPDWLEPLGASALMAQPWLMLQLVWTFQRRHRLIDGLSAVGLGASVCVIWIWDAPYSATATTLLVGYFVVVEVYATAGLLVGAWRKRGVVRWQMGLAGTGSLLLAGIITLAGVASVRPDLAAATEGPAGILVVATAACWGIGFVPPARLRRVWQLEEFHELVRSLSTPGAVVHTCLAEAAQRAIGGQAAVHMPDTTPPALWRWLATLPDTAVLSARELPAGLEERGKQVLVAKLVARGDLLGVVVVPMRHGSLFPQHDLRLLQDMSSQAALRLAEQRDLLAKAQAVDRLREANDALERANRQQSEFLANMSHELRTPLNSIIGFSQLVVDGRLGEIPPRPNDVLRDVLGSAHHLLALIDDLLDLARIEAGRVRLEPQDVDPEVLVQQVCKALRPNLGDLTLEIFVDPSVGTIHTDPIRFRQILTNYLGNAAKFTEHGRIVVTLAPAGYEHFRLSVADTGIGIAADDLPRLFSKFQQLDSGAAKRFQGTGLGLALTRQLAEAMGGSVGVDSVLGKGSTFWARLPRQMSSDDAAPQGQRPVIVSSNQGG